MNKKTVSSGPVGKAATLLLLPRRDALPAGLTKLVLGRAVDLLDGASNGLRSLRLSRRSAAIAWDVGLLQL